MFIDNHFVVAQIITVSSVHAFQFFNKCIFYNRIVRHM